MITNIKTAAVYVSDQQAALRFYTQVLGFEVRQDHPMGPSGNWIEVAPPGAQTRIVIYPRAVMKGWEEMKPSIVFGCPDTEAAYQHLTGKGVTFTQKPTEMAWGTFATFQDQDGNQFLLTEGA